MHGRFTVQKFLVSVMVNKELTAARESRFSSHLPEYSMQSGQTDEYRGPSGPDVAHDMRATKSAITIGLSDDVARGPLKSL